MRRRDLSEELGQAERERLRLKLRVKSGRIAAARREAGFERLTLAAGMGFWECDLRTEALRWSSGVYALFGRSATQPLNRAATLAQYSPASKALLTAKRAQAISEGSGFTLDTEIETLDGQSRWIRITAVVERRGDRPVRLFGVKQDVTEEILLLARIRHLAESDPLTGLSNRACFEARLGGSVGTLFLVDLDGFKAVNDTYGHQAGDGCLREAARRLREACCGAELLARIGGDEFAILFEARLSREAAADQARSIVEALGQPVDCRGWRYQVGASVGVAVAAPEITDLFACADIALYAAKAAGRYTFRLYDPSVAAPMTLGSRAAG